MLIILVVKVLGVRISLVIIINFNIMGLGILRFNWRLLVCFRGKIRRIGLVRRIDLLVCRLWGIN